MHSQHAHVGQDEGDGGMMICSIVYELTKRVVLPVPGDPALDKPHGTYVTITRVAAG